MSCCRLPVGEGQLASLPDSRERPLPKILVPTLKLVFFPGAPTAALPGHTEQRAGCSQTVQSIRSIGLNRKASEGQEEHLSHHDWGTIPLHEMVWL